MRADIVDPPPRRFARRLRVAWAVLTVFAVESVVIALAALPAVAFWSWHLRWQLPDWARAPVLALAFVPAYLLFALGLILYSAAAMRLLGWRTAEGVDVPVASYERPVLNWARYLVSTHVVRVFAGAVFRATPVWTLYLRLNGARVGRGAWVNSLALMDHNLLEIGEGTVVGSDAHVSGHTVEAGRLRTARVRIGRGVTVGIGTVVEIGAEIGDGAQIGALSVVPKFARLEAGGVYAGAPVHDLRASRHEPASRLPEM
jgi:acetyltransferase-like isoleucine patch superfamily enzyme